MEHLNYRPGRTPVTPVGLVIGDRIIAVHTIVGNLEETVDITVAAKRTRKVGPGHAEVTIWWDGDVDEAGEKPHRVFDDPAQWLSVVPRRVKAAA